MAIYLPTLDLPHSWVTCTAMGYAGVQHGMVHAGIQHVRKPLFKLMANQIKSVLQPDNVRYCSVDGFYEDNLLVYAFGMYETLGDGECQHTPAYRIGASHFTDFCLSLAAYVLANPDCDVRDYQVGLKQISKEAYDFLRSVTYKENKRQWYSLQLRKVSSKDEKRYDKRWQEVPTWADGSVKAAYDLFRMNWECRKTFLERYATLSQFREMAGGSFYQQDECEPWIQELTGDHCQAFRALQSAMAAKEHREWATRLIESAVHNSTPKAEPVAA